MLVLHLFLVAMTQVCHTSLRLPLLRTEDSLLLLLPGDQCPPAPPGSHLQATSTLSQGKEGWHVGCSLLPRELVQEGQAAPMSRVRREAREGGQELLVQALLPPKTREQCQDLFMKLSLEFFSSCCHEEDPRCGLRPLLSMLHTEEQEVGLGEELPARTKQINEGIFSSDKSINTVIVVQQPWNPFWNPTANVVCIFFIVLLIFLLVVSFVVRRLNAASKIIRVRYFVVLIVITFAQDPSFFTTSTIHKTLLQGAPSRRRFSDRLGRQTSDLNCKPQVTHL